MQQLIRQAHREVDEVHAIVLPELALSDKLARDLAASLMNETAVELFITGAICHDGGQGQTDRKMNQQEVNRNTEKVHQNLLNPFSISFRS